MSFLQLHLFPLRVQKLLTYVCCNCESDTGSRDDGQIAGQFETKEMQMERIVLNVFGFAVALGTSGLMFAVTLA